MTTQRSGLPPASHGDHRTDGPKTDHALTIKLDHSGGADYSKIGGIVLRCFCVLICFILHWTSASGEPLEVHAVGVYEGYTRTNEKIHGPRAKVLVDRPGKRVFLVLGSHEAIRWMVTVSPQTTVDRVFVHGFRADRSEIILDGSPVAAEVIDVPSTHVNEGYVFRELLKFFSEAIEVDRIASFHGSYRAPENSFIIDKFDNFQHNSVRYLESYLRPELLTDVQREFLSGSMEPAARLDEGGFYLRTGGEEVHYPITLDVPTVHWPGRAAYDPVKQRLFAGTAWHHGFFYTYDISNDTWSAVEQPKSLVINGAVYDLDRGVLIVGVYGDYAGKSTSRIMEMTADGRLSDIRYDELIGFSDLEDRGNGPPAVLLPLILDGDSLLAVAKPDMPISHMDGNYRLYQINLETGRVNLVGVSY